MDFSQSIEEVEFMSRLGRGGFGFVFKAKSTVTKKVIAVKVLKKSEICKSEYATDAVINELKLLKRLKGMISFTQLVFANQDQNCLFIGLEFCRFGDLHHIQMRLPEQKFKEESGMTLMAEMLFAIDLLHKFGIIHRDLKPDNIMMADDKHIKIGDFNLSTELTRKCKKARSILGTPGYVSFYFSKSGFTKSYK